MTRLCLFKNCDANERVQMLAMPVFDLNDSTVSAVGTGGGVNSCQSLIARDPAYRGQRNTQLIPSIMAHTEEVTSSEMFSLASIFINSVHQNLQFIRLEEVKNGLASDNHNTNVTRRVTLLAQSILSTTQTEERENSTPASCRKARIGPSVQA